MRITICSPSQRRSGTATIELSIVLPFLMVLLFGIWEVGRLIEATNVLSNAAREGARNASTGTMTAAQVQTLIQSYITSAGFNANGLTVRTSNLTKNPDKTGGSDNPQSANQLDHMQVELTLPFDNVKWVFLNQITNVQNLSASADWFCMRDKPLVLDAAMPK